MRNFNDQSRFITMLHANQDASSVETDVFCLCVLANVPFDAVTQNGSVFETETLCGRQPCDSKDLQT